MSFSDYNAWKCQLALCTTEDSLREGLWALHEAYKNGEVEPLLYGELHRFTAARLSTVQSVSTLVIKLDNVFIEHKHDTLRAHVHKHKEFLAYVRSERRRDVLQDRAIDYVAWRCRTDEEFTQVREAVEERMLQLGLKETAFW